MTSIYLLTLRQLSGRWRLLIIALAAVLPPLVARLQSRNAPAQGEFELAILGSLILRAAVPLVVLATGTAAFGNEIEDRTLANLTLAPVPRWRIVASKLLAVITVAGLFMAASAFTAAQIAFPDDVRTVVTVTVATLLGVMLYASVFLWLGLVSAQAIGIGLFYVVVWEGLLSGALPGVRMLSIRHYAIAVMHALDPRHFAAADLVSPSLAAAAALVVFGGFFLLTVRRLRRMDVP